MEKNEQKDLKKIHTVEIFNREKIDMTTAKEVVSCTDKEVIVKLDDGAIVICGSGMTIAKLVPEEGLLSVTGKISGVRYENKLNKKSFIGRIFK